MVKVICGLGNPGPEYEATRHNVGWWVLERVQRDWHLPPFRRKGATRLTDGAVSGHDVVLVQPLTYMNRSGHVLAGLREDPAFDIARDLLVVVDDTALEVGRVRIRAAGSSGGHNGLKSIEAALRTQEYARLRVGVGQRPEGVDLADWVLSPFEDKADEQAVLELVQTLPDALRLWLDEGVDAVAARFNR